MAELVGLTASIVAITGAAGCAAKVSVKMLRVAKTLAAAGEEMEDFADDIQLFSTAVDTSLDSLKEFSKTPALVASPLLKSFIERKGFAMLIKKSERTQRHISRAWDTAELMQTKRRLFPKTRLALDWFIQQPEILALRSELDGFKADISFIMHTLTLQLRMIHLESSNDMPDEIYRQQFIEIKRLKAHIDVLVEEISLNQKREKRRNQRQSRRSSSQQEPHEISNTLEDILVDFGSSIVVEASNSSERDSSPSSSTRSGIFLRPSEATTDASTPPSTPQSGSSHSSRFVPPTTRSEDPHTSRYVKPPSSVYRFLGTELAASDPPLRRPPKFSQVENRRAPEQQHMPSAQLPPLRHRQERPVQAVLDSIPTPSTQIEPTSSNSEKVASRQSEGSSPIRFAKALGFINTPKGLVQAKAKITTDFPEHAISAEYAGRLDLPIKAHGDGSGDGTRMLESFFSSGEEVVSTGTVELEWRGASKTPPFIIKCRVFPDQPEDLVFGKNFLERRTFYANGGEDEYGGEWLR